MSERPEAPKLDTRHAHSARVYNYWLGGKDNFAADREAAEKAIEAFPGLVAWARHNRAFLARASATIPGLAAIACSAASRSAAKLSLPPSQ